MSNKTFEVALLIWFLPDVSVVSGVGRLGSVPLTLVSRLITLYSLLVRQDARSLAPNPQAYAPCEAITERNWPELQLGAKFKWDVTNKLNHYNIDNHFCTKWTHF